MGTIIRIIVLIKIILQSVDLLKMSGASIDEEQTQVLSPLEELFEEFAFGALQHLGAFIIVVALICIVFLTGLVVITIITGVIAHSNYNKMMVDNFMGDSITKIIIDSIFSYYCVTNIITTQPWWIIIAILPITVVVLCIVSLCIKPRTIDQ